ncbi:MAG: Asp-tRNA(Asn)/Glu-tRNA(Gln) amidotransferase subunit GatB [bacterium]|nr:Asp-tRNA(Asn)/Glu-tRNA(Gln) amidotransferase subunit GatB [bacterium]
MNLEAVIGLEVHCQLASCSKIFCSCPTKFGALPNTQVCPVCLGLPGVLPVFNKRVLELAIISGLALSCKINNHSRFHRKNYFYPDLPKAYQISQYDEPLATGGSINLDGKKIGITRLHLEEDAGKLMHAEGASLVDFNRCGIPLIEIVSEPDIRSPEEAYAYLTEIKAILQYTEVSNCNMEEGSLRCDVNVSIRREGEGLGEKVEIKNLNSFRGVEKALHYEIERQIEVIKSGRKVFQETRLFDEKKQVTFTMRAKEEAKDYRYFPEPDLLPLIVEKEQIESLKSQVPELASQKKERFMKDYGLSEYDAKILTSTKEMAIFFETCLRSYDKPKIVNNWITTELLGLLAEKKKKLADSLVKPELLTKMLLLIDDGVISGKIGKDVFAEIFASGKDPEEIIKEKGLVQIKDTDSLYLVIDEVLSENPQAIKDYQEGKKKAVGSLIGQIMKKTMGRANPELANQLLLKRLGEDI